MVAEKGLPPEVADRIGEYVVLSGRPQELLAKLTAPGFPLAEHPDAKVLCASCMHSCQRIYEAMVENTHGKGRGHTCYGYVAQPREIIMNWLHPRCDRNSVTHGQ